MLAVGLVPGSAGAKTIKHRLTLKPHAFASCASLVQYARGHFAVTGGVPDVPVRPVGVASSPTEVSISAGNTPTAAAAPAAPVADSKASTTDFSTTNDQEEGVDEPDIVKTDGSTIFSIENGTLRAVAVKGGVPSLVGSLTIPDAGSAQLLLRRSRLIVISSSGFSGYAIDRAAAPRLVPLPPAGGDASTVVTEVDVGDPAAMKIARTMTIDGSYVDARQNGATARLVIASTPRAVTNEATRSTVSGWVPMRRFRSSLTTRHYVRPVADCKTIAHPRQFSGLGTLTILTINLDHGLYTADSDALMADAQVVYGSTKSLYVATQKWVRPTLAVSDLPPSETTVIQRFDVSDPDRTTAVSTGEVPGYLLNQFSLSEDGGHLRVASTSRPTWWNGQQVGAPSQSSITVLDEHADRLDVVGRLDGLGTNQHLYSVRFAGDSAYVVTFRQIDPLYVIDLSDPAAPKVAGELEIQGYSSYLQLVGDGLLLGIGADVGLGATGGTQLELFNVSNPSAPKLVSKVALGGSSSSTAQYDHHALLFWAPTQLAVLPVQIYGSGPIVAGPLPPTVPGAQSAPSSAFVGAIGYRIDASGIAEVGRVTHDPVASFLPAVQRSLVIGSRLFTLSSAGIMASSLDTLTRQSFAAFGG